MFQRLVNLFGILEIRDGIALAVIAYLPGVRIQLKELRASEPTDRGITGRSIEECRQCLGITKRTQRSEHLQPRFLQQLPGIGLGRCHAAKVIKKRSLPELDDSLECGTVASLPADNQEGRLEQLSILRQIVLLSVGRLQDAGWREKVHFNWIGRREWHLVRDAAELDNSLWFRERHSLSMDNY